MCTATTFPVLLKCINEPLVHHRPHFILLQHISEPEFNPVARLDAETFCGEGKGEQGEAEERELTKNLMSKELQQAYQYQIQALPTPLSALPNTLTE